MPEPVVTIAWVVLALGVGVAALRRGASPVTAPLLPAIATASTFAAAAAVGGLDVTWQVGVAVAMTAVLSIVAWRWRSLIADDRLSSGVGGRRLIGVTATVIEPVSASEPGRVHVLGDDWPATTTDAHVLPVDSEVVVQRVQGIRLRVTAAAVTTGNPAGETGGAPPSDRSSDLDRDLDTDLDTDLETEPHPHPGGH